MSLGRHVTLKREDSASSEPDKMEKVSDVIEMSGIEESKDIHEDTPYGGDEGDYRTFSSGLKDVSEITLSARYKGAAQQTQVQALVDAYNNDTYEKIQFVFPAPINQKVTLTVLVSKVGIPLSEKGGRITRELAVKPSGEPVWESV